jgi:hypothetical protein
MTKRKLIGALIAGIALGFSASPLAAFAAGITNGLKGINLQGVGVGAISLLDCPSVPCASGAGNCRCFTSNSTMTQKGNVSAFNGGSLDLVLSVDTGGLLSPNCTTATGTGSLLSKNGKVSQTMDFSGFVCPTFDAAARVFNGTYIVTGGTGPTKNPATHGTGAINGSLEGTEARVSFDGNQQ